MAIYPEPQQRAVRIIESLRSGIPTRMSTSALPDLRGYLTEKIKEDLRVFAVEGKAPPGRLVWGPYGQGKTHILTSIEHAALDMGFAVSRVTLSREVSCHQPFAFYERLASALITPDSLVMGLHKKLNEKTLPELRQSPLAQPQRYSHPWPLKVLENYFFAEGEDQELLYGDLTGTRLQLKELRRIHKQYQHEALAKFADPFKITLHAPAYFGLMADLVQFCGYKGWVLLVDEVELLGRLGKVSRMKAYQTLNWLLNWSQTLTYPIYFLGAAASRLQDDTWYGGDNQRRKDDREIISDLATERLGKAAAKELQQFFKRAASKDCPVMRPVHENELTAFLEHIISLHGQAYAWEPQLKIEELLHYLGNQTVRTYIRGALEALDQAFLYASHEKISTAELIEHDLAKEDEAFFSTEAEGKDE